MSDVPTILVAFLLAGIVKGVLGMGLPSVAIAVLGIAMPTAQAAALVVIPSLVTNVWQFAAGPALAAVVRRFGTLILAGVIGIFAAIGLLTAGSGQVANAVLGSVLVAYGLFGLANIRFQVPERIEWWLSPLIGLATGLLMGGTGIYVIPAVPYFAALRIERDELVQLMGFAFSTSTIAFGIALLALGEYRLTAAAGSLIGLAAAFVGLAVGRRLRVRLDPEAFRRWYFVGMVVIGGYMLWRVFA